MNVQRGGDDLGGIWYTFKNATLPEAINYILKQTSLVHESYDVVLVDIRRKYWFFGPIEVFILLEKPEANDKDPNNPWTKLKLSLHESIKNA